MNFMKMKNPTEMIRVPICVVTIWLLTMIGNHLALAAPTNNAPNTSSYSAKGVVEKVAPDNRQVTIHHEAIPGYMMEMTMDFPVHNTNELEGISPGDKITFTLVVNQTNAWVENIRRMGQKGKVMDDAMPMKVGEDSELKPGDTVPDGELISESGRHIHFSDFRGKAVALTFFFTRCPLPNYCPLMNRNFSAARELIQSRTNAPGNWEFLSVSFDPAHDTPETLEEFAKIYRGENAGHWLFATADTNTLAGWAPRIGLMVMQQGSSISHNLRTIVIDPEGRLFRQFNGNEWTPQELADAMIEAAAERVQK